MKPGRKHEPPALPFVKTVKKGVTSYTIPHSYGHLFPPTRRPRNREERLLKFREDLTYYRTIIPKVRIELVKNLNYADYIIEDLALLHGEHGDIIQDTIRHAKRTADFLRKKLQKLEESGEEFNFGNRVGSPLRQIATLHNFLDKIEAKAERVKDKFEDELRDEVD